MFKKNVKKMDEMSDFGELKSKLLDFRRYVRDTLTDKLQTFLSCVVTYYEFPKVQLRETFGIDILNNPYRSLYIVDDNTIIIVVRIYESKACIGAFLGIRFSREKIIQDNHLYEEIAKQVSKSLTYGYQNGFRNSLQFFGDLLIKTIISRCVSRGCYSHQLMMFAIDYFDSLRTTSFEGNFFSTGMIISKSHYAFIKDKDSLRGGVAHKLEQPMALLTMGYDRRFWYLADGKHTYYLCGPNLLVSDLFFTDSNSEGFDYISVLTLRETLRGDDVLFRIESAKELSIINSKGSEFIFKENGWKFRNYINIYNLINAHISISMKVFDFLLYYVLYCSKNGVSSIIWIPENCNDMDILLNKNKPMNNNVTITDPVYSPLILRLLSSDGATVVSKEGEVLYFGGIVKLDMTQIEGVHGTGETATSLLAKNGIAIKVSQDGAIKLAVNENQTVIL